MIYQEAYERQGIQNFENIVNPLLNKPKPKADPPPQCKENSSTENKDGQGDHSPKQDRQNGNPDEKMDVE